MPTVAVRIPVKYVRRDVGEFHVVPKLTEECLVGDNDRSEVPHDLAFSTACMKYVQHVNCGQIGPHLHILGCCH